MLFDQVADGHGVGFGVPAEQNRPSGQGRPVVVSVGVGEVDPVAEG